MTEASRIIIRELRADDVAAVNDIHNQRSVAEGTLQIPFHTLAERQARFVSDASQRFIVAELEGTVVGAAGLTLYARRRAHTGGLGMAVDERYQGRGVGHALMNALIDLADNWYNLRRLELEVYTDNAPGVHLYQKHGFVIEGTLRGYAFRAGRYADAYAMARLRNDPPII